MDIMELEERSKRDETKYISYTTIVGDKMAKVVVNKTCVGRERVIAMHE